MGVQGKWNEKVKFVFYIPKDYDIGAKPEKNGLYLLNY